MQEISFKNSYGDTLKGVSWLTEKANKNFLIITGMQEHAYRYDNFAKFLNKAKYNVYCLDHYGQGLNIENDNNPGVWPIDGFEKSADTFKEFYMSIASNHPTVVFGHSMGSFFTQRLINKYPDIFDKVIICGTDFPSPSLMKFGYNYSKLLVKKKNFNSESKKIHKLVTGNFAKQVKGAKTEFDWLSYNKENVDQYIKDPRCGFIATNGFYQEFLKGMRNVAKKENLNKINKNIKIFIIAGEDDPVGHFGKGPAELFKKYKSLGIKNVDLKIYSRMRHEILNEKEKEIVYNDILNFLKK